MALCNASGLTRTTIYNILEGRVINVQQSTIRKISDFFGVSYIEIETVDFEDKELIESSVSVRGNKNPAAVPVIRESLLMHSLEKRIGELATIFPLTYYFGVASNLIGVLLESEIEGVNDLGDLLIVKKGYSSSGKEKLAYRKATKRLFITCESDFDDRAVVVVGEIMEERFNG